MRAILILAAMFVAPGASAAPQQATERASAQTPSLADMHAATTGYSQFLARVQEIEAPIQQGMVRLSAEWNATDWRSDTAAAAESFRPRLREMLALIDAANTRLEALDTPDFPALELPADSTPATLRRETIRLNGEFRDVVGAFEPLLQAMVRADMSAVLSANARLMSSLRVLINSQILFARAGQASVDRDASTWHVMDVQLHFFRALSRLISAFPSNGISGIDRALPRDLVAIAGDIDATSSAGSARLADELVELRASAGEADNRDPAGARLFRDAAEVLRIEGELFELGRRLSQLLRETASRFERQPIQASDLAEKVRPFQAIRQEIDAIIARSIAVHAR